PSRPPMSSKVASGTSSRCDLRFVHRGRRCHRRSHLEEVPDATFDDIGGLGEQIGQIRDSVELPFLYPELYHEHRLQPPKGILLYGPPGTGKTLIAKAVAQSLTGRVDGVEHSYFLNIKGPELLNKYVGETERHIRTIFSRAREMASAGY